MRNSLSAIAECGFFKKALEKIHIPVRFWVELCLIYPQYVPDIFVGLKLLPVESPEGYSDKNDTGDYRRDQRQP